MLCRMDVEFLNMFTMVATLYHLYGGTEYNDGRTNELPDTQLLRFFETK